MEGKLPPADKDHYGMVNDPTVWMLLAKMYLNAEVYIGEMCIRDRNYSYHRTFPTSLISIY